MEITILPMGIQENSVGNHHYCYGVACAAMNAIHNSLTERILFASKTNDQPIIINVCMDAFTRSIWQNIYNLRRYSPLVSIRVYRMSNEVNLFACRSGEGQAVILSDRQIAKSMIDEANEMKTLFPGDKSIDVDYWDEKQKDLTKEMLRNADAVYLFTEDYDHAEDIRSDVIRMSPNAFSRTVCMLDSMRTTEF